MQDSEVVAEITITGRANRPQGCHTCKRGRGNWCITCRRIDFDDISIRNSPHADPAAIEETLADPRAYIPGQEPNRPATVTPLSPETEEALLMLLAKIAQLPPKAVLTFHGLLNGWGIAEIGRATGVSRQTAHARLKAAMLECPWLGDFYQAGLPADHPSR